LLVILIAVFCAQDAWAIEKIVCFPERINVDSTIEAKLRAAISAGADGVVFDQWSKEVPFTRIRMSVRGFAAVIVALLSTNSALSGTLPIMRNGIAQGSL
jgi:hypothetical protein